MIDVSREDLYEASLDQLQEFKSAAGPYRGRSVQLFLALKFYQSDLPSVRSGQTISTGTLQEMIDDLYAKESRPENDSVLMLFEHGYAARTGVVAPGNKYPTNTWRNNFNLQKGVGCYAGTEDLTDINFLNQPRKECPHLLLPEEGEDGLADCTCALAQEGPRYRGEQHRKWLQIKGDGSGYAVVDPTLIANYRGYVESDQGTKVPFVPAMIALCYDASPALLIGMRNELDTADFAADFNFSVVELQAYFDDDPGNPHNQALKALEPGLEWTRFSDLPGLEAVEPEQEGAEEVEAEALPAPTLGGTPALPPEANTGFEAEQFVAQLFRDAGWQVDDVSRQQVGYDLHVTRHGRGTLYVEVKSSVGVCTPVLTVREWRQARRRGEEYVLAVVEHFDPQGENSVHWVRNVAFRCVATQSTTVQYSLPRSSWSAATDPFPAIIGEEDE